jgi:hypothetical protein
VEAAGDFARWRVAARGRSMRIAHTEGALQPEVSMRLIKLFFYATMGYFIYQLFQGMRQPAAAGAGMSAGGRERIGSRDLRRALNEDEGRMNVTGPARGTTISTEEPGGAQMRHVVGRGVVSR